MTAIFPPFLERDQGMGAGPAVTSGRERLLDPGPQRRGRRGTDLA